MRILLVEDDAQVGDAVIRALTDAAFAVNWVQDGVAALAAIRSEEYSVILLDLGLPRKDGYEVLRELRNNNETMPVIVITARDAVADRIKGLDLGADDYLVKPFSIDELMARIRAVVRRNRGIANPILSNSVLELNPATCEASREGEVYALSGREFGLLHALMLGPGKIISRSSLEEQVYGWNEEVASNAIEFTIHALRKKLGKDVIKNVRGLGWMVEK